MARKILLEIRGNPSTGDVLVYSEAKAAWQAVPKDEFLSRAFAGIRESERKIAEQSERIGKAEERLALLAANLNKLANAIGGNS